MRRIRQTKPSAALIVAVVALVAALAGTAIAGVAVTSLSKKDKKQVTKIAKKQGKKQAKIQIDKKAPGLSVASAKTADSATTADSAKMADSADDANGIKPVKVSFAAASSSGETVFVNQGGIRIDGECTGNGPQVDFESTANDGDLYLFFSFDDGSTGRVDLPNFDAGNFSKVAPLGGLISLQTTVTYRGADGTTVSGELMEAEGAGAAQCRIGGTLFVG